MKKLFMLLPALLMIFSLKMNAVAQPTQDFELVTFPPVTPGIWSLEYTSTLYWSRLAGTSGYAVGTGSAKFNFFNASTNVTQSLITPNLLTSGAGDSLKFDHSYRTYTGGEVDTLRIFTSTDAGTTWSVLVTLEGSPTVGVGMTTRLPSTSSAPPTLASEWGTKAYALPVGTNKIKFTAISDFGNNLFLDNIKTKAILPITIDASTLSIDSPVGNTLVNGPTIAPKATFKNVGTTNMTSIPVTFKIRGPVNYTSTKTITTLNAGAQIQVIFDSTFVPNTLGSYIDSVYCGAATDGNRLNDTLVSAFNIINNPDYGTGTGGIFFANSIATGAPSKPEVCFADTTGGRTLCKNGVYFDSTVFTGTLDDGYWRLGGSNLGLPAGYKIRLNGVDYDSIFVSTNGILGLTFNTNLGDFSPEALPSATHGVELYPLWKDFDLRTEAGPDSYVKVLVRGTRLYVYWLARTYNVGGPSADVVFFGASIELVNTATDSRIIYQYGDASKGTTASFVTAVNNNTLADHVIGLQSNNIQYIAYRQRITTLTAFGPMFANVGGAELAVEFGTNAATLNNKCATLNLKACLEVCPGDVATVSLYNTSCGLIDSRQVTVNGTSVPLSLAGVDNTPSQYYIKVSHKNSVTVWSNAITFTGYSASYDFTTGLSQVYGGNNLKNNGGTWCIITGDVNKDGTVDATDGSSVDNDAISGVEGSISGFPTDLNCDAFVDGSDLSAGDNNVAFGYFEDSPCPSPNDFVVKERVPGPFDGYIALPEQDKRSTDEINKANIKNTK
ncbi:MAG: hypothetical protein WAU38_08945 [Ignavibacteria bacterium]